ncbi:MAG: hypothetical protein QGG40_00240 [Myxococcota bacterium]|nr:hypothetical protein [Myxococcota bacterium]
MADPKPGEDRAPPTRGGLASLLQGSLAWWLVPLLLGLGLAALFLGFGSFGPEIELFYSVF